MQKTRTEDAVCLLPNFYIFFFSHHRPSWWGCFHGHTQSVPLDVSVVWNNAYLLPHELSIIDLRTLITIFTAVVVIALLYIYILYVIWWVYCIYYINYTSILMCCIKITIQSIFNYIYNLTMTNDYCI